MIKKAIIWDYKYNDMKISWKLQMQWVVKALQDEGYKVVKRPKFKCEGLENLSIYNCKTDNPCDIVVYNHTDVSHLIGNVAIAKRNWFFKPTVPDKYHTTLDELGYSAYSSITYKKPPFEKSNLKEVKKFFNTKVKNWIETKASKFYDFKSQNIEILEDDYYLILGQCGGDYTVTSQAFGNHFRKIHLIAQELLRITDKQIVIKLHPYTDGEHAKDDKLSRNIAEKLSRINERVTVYLGKGNIHKFIKKAKVVLLSNSGAGFEVMMHHKPMITWGYPEYHWVSYDLRHLCDLNKALKLDWFSKEKQDRFLYWYMEKYCFYNLETTKKRVRELLNGTQS